MSYELGTSFRYKQTGAKRRLVEIQETCQYVPLLPNLEKLLNNQDIYQEVYFVFERYDCMLYDLFLFYRLLNHMQEMMILLVTFAMPLYTIHIRCILLGINPSNFNLSSIMMRLKSPILLDLTRGSIN